MTIKDGYDGKKTRIKISKEDDGTRGWPRGASLWIEQDGLSLIKSGRGRQATYRKGKLEELKDMETYFPDNKTLAYITLEELLALRDECNAAIQELVK